MYLPVPQSRQWIIRKLSTAYLKNLAMGRAIVVDEVEKALSPDQRFYILGVSPNAARIAVRFFLSG